MKNITYRQHAVVVKKKASSRARSIFFALTTAAIMLTSNAASALTFNVGDGATTTAADGSTSLDIVDHEVDNSVFDPWDDQQAEINFTINKAAKVTVEILENNNKEVKTIIDGRQYDQSGNYSVKWDGRDKFGDIVDDDTYTYRVSAESGAEFEYVKGDVIVNRGYENIDSDTVSPSFKRFYVTKEEYDPNFKEKNYVVFTLTAESDVKGVVYDNFGKEIYTYIDEDNLSTGTHTVQLDYDRLAGQTGILNVRLNASNAKGNDTISQDVKIVEEDDNNSKKPNIFKDYSDGTPFKPQKGHLAINFYTDRDSEVTVEIRDGDFVVATVVDAVELSEGSHTVYWDGRDKFGEIASDGIYQYKILAGNFQGRDTEKGNFSIEASADANPVGQTCAGFSDVSKSYHYCDAIKWAKAHDVVSGFQDGTFKPESAVTRVQALKMILEAMDVKIISNGGQNLGFPDTYKYDWYADYLRTGLALGVVNGYPDKSFRPNNYVLRAEGLVMALNTARSKGEIVIPTMNYGQPYFDTPNTKDTNWYINHAWFAQQYDLTDNDNFLYPADIMTRGEMADLLYRYSQSGFGQ